MSGDLGDFLAEGGAIVGGGAAIGAVLGFVGGLDSARLQAEYGPDDLARLCGFFGGLVGLVAFVGDVLPGRVDRSGRWD